MKQHFNFEIIHILMKRLEWGGRLIMGPIGSGKTRSFYRMLTQQVPSDDRSKAAKTESTMDGSSTGSTSSAEKQLETVMFDTYAMVQHLETQGFSPNQAQELTQILHSLLQTQYAHHAAQLLSPGHHHTSTSQYNLSLHNLKQELTTLRTTETQSLQLAHTNLYRDLDLMQLKFRDEMHKLKSDSLLDLNTRKSESGEGRQKSEMKLKELEQRVQLMSGRLKSEVEMVKMELVTKWASGIGLATMLGIALALKL